MPSEDAGVVVEEQEGVPLKPVVVTGAGGYIGNHVVYQLLHLNLKVRATVRDPSAPRNVFLKNIHPNGEKNLELFTADLEDETCWDAVMKGVDYVVHVASPFPLNMPKDAMELISPAVNGVTNVLNAAVRAKVKRVVQSSSIAAICQGHPDEDYHNQIVYDETKWSVPEKQDAYGKSKTLAEKKVWEIAAQPESEHTEFVCINPALVLGPVFQKSSDVSSSVKIMKILLDRVYPRAAGFGVSVVDVRDVAATHIQALFLPRDVVHNNRFAAVSVPRMNFCDMGVILKDKFGQYGFNPPTKDAPYWFVTLLSFFSDVAKVARDEYGTTHAVSGDKAAKVFGINWRDFSQTVKDQAVSMMKCDIVTRRKFPQEELDAFKVYNDDDSALTLIAKFTHNPLVAA